MTSAAAANTWRMGFNPFRPRRGRPTADYVYVAAGLLVVVLLVLWAAIGL